MPIEITNPDALGKRAAPYSILTRVHAGSELLFLSGLAAGDGPPEESEGLDVFDRQCHQVFRSIGAALASAGAGYANIVQFTTYLVDRADIPRFRSYRQREFPRLFPNKIYPPNTLAVVSALADEHYRIEVHTIAAL
jgi:enamine deaminase RidA (YjgF/YER057c/UK114 family)